MRVQSRDTENRTVSVGKVLTLLITLNRCLFTRKQILDVQTDIFEPFRRSLLGTDKQFEKKLLTCTEKLLLIYFCLNIFQEKPFFQTRCRSLKSIPEEVSLTSSQRLSPSLYFLAFFFNQFIIRSSRRRSSLKKLTWQILKVTVKHLSWNSMLGNFTKN